MDHNFNHGYLLLQNEVLVAHHSINVVYASTFCNYISFSKAIASILLNQWSYHYYFPLGNEILYSHLE